MKVALIGNPNSGKSTVFNRLTGSSQHVGNFPGITVEKKSCRLKSAHEDVEIVDLPGIYSLSPYTDEELLTRDYLLKETPDCIINIVDATNIERNLYLTLQLIDLGIPMVIALNMMDSLRASGGTVQLKEFEEELGVEVVPISAAKNEGIDELTEHIVKIGKNKIMPRRTDHCSGDVHRAIHSIEHIIEDEAKAKGVSVRFAATKLVEGDDVMLKELNVQDPEIDIIGHIVEDMEFHTSMDREAALADERYNYIERLCARTVIKPEISIEHERSLKIDAVLTHKVFAIPIFLGIMMLIFWLTFGVIGASLSGAFAGLIDDFTCSVDAFLTSVGLNPVLQSLIINGVFAGVGSVLSFLPTIVLLFFFLSLLEDTGYMARVAFVMDGFLRKMGLSGRSFVPMLIGFGCSVPAIMATHSLPSDRDRRMTIMLTPFMSCSAKLPIYALFTAAFFAEYGALVMISLYIFGIVTGIIAGLFMKKILFKGDPVPFVMELPSYRFPDAKSVMLHMWEKAKDFIQKAFTVIFIATIIIWILQTFDVRFFVVEDSADSILAAVGRVIAPVFAPLGFGSWQASTALLTGFSGKEAVVSTITVLVGGNVSNISTIFTPLTAYVFLIFCLLYSPCVAAFAAVKREMGGIMSAVGVAVFQTGIAWVMSFIVYRIGLLLIG